MITGADPINESSFIIDVSQADSIACTKEMTW